MAKIAMSHITSIPSFVEEMETFEIDFTVSSDFTFTISVGVYCSKGCITGERGWGSKEIEVSPYGWTTQGRGSWRILHGYGEHPETKSAWTDPYDFSQLDTLVLDLRMWAGVEGGVAGDCDKLSSEVIIYVGDQEVWSGSVTARDDDCDNPANPNERILMDEEIDVSGISGLKRITFEVTRGAYNPPYTGGSATAWFDNLRDGGGELLDDMEDLSGDGRIDTGGRYTIEATAPKVEEFRPGQNPPQKAWLMVGGVDRERDIYVDTRDVRTVMVVAPGAKICDTITIG